MTPTPFDHALVALLLLAAPVYGWLDYRKLQARLAAGQSVARLREYQATIALQWGLSAVLLLTWFAQDRAAGALGLTVPLDRRSLLGLGVTLAALAFLAYQWYAIGRIDEADRARLRAQLAGARELLPTDDAEHRWFRALALTAGICEELIYRGFLIAYAAHWLGEIGGLLAAALGFGLGHFYQGRAGVLKTTLVGIAAGWLYQRTGALLWPMILHAALDLQGGAIGRRLHA
jgi:membrane protease YdiL (CAAX protease family)